ncbi:hypothetical protein J6590_002747 [Homalodisca vitripennis]|nr:hypothetical protein J6590_002747 [Homalodisca vitripennis]
MRTKHNSRVEESRKSTKLPDGKENTGDPVENGQRNSSKPSDGKRVIENPTEKFPKRSSKSTHGKEDIETPMVKVQHMKRGLTAIVNVAKVGQLIQRGEGGLGKPRHIYHTSSVSYNLRDYTANVVSKSCTGGQFCAYTTVLWHWNE